MSDQPHVLFVVLDSARKDRVSAYGHERETTPTLDALAREATRYDAAFTPAPWTLPSHCSMFTGEFPTEHGVTNGFADRAVGLSDGTRTVTERLSDRGYRTAGFSNNPWVGQLSGLDRGFDQFVEWDLQIARSEGPTRARDRVCSRLHSLLGRAAGQPHVLLKRRFFTSNLVDRATRWIRDGDGPTFTFLNLMEAHSPYYPPREAFRELGLSPPNPLSARLLNVRLLAYVMGRTDLDAAQRERVLEFYDASLRYQDHKLRQLLAALREEDVYDETLVVVCADHGKTLGEFDREGTPPHYLRDVNANVPLVVKPPGGGGPDRVLDPVELTDLYDLVLEGGENGLARGHNPLAAGPDTALVEDHLPHTGNSAETVTRWRALADRTHKYVRSEDGREFLFDRRAGERVRDTAEIDRYRNRLVDRIGQLETAATPAHETGEDDEIGGAVESQLQDLGYLE